MTQRRTSYTVAEIDAMRRDVETLCADGGCYRADERSRQVEERLRTYMLNGTSPSELRDAAIESMASRQEALRREMEFNVRSASRVVAEYRQED